ncbi:MAG TPA: ATP-binding cassette domain-containing protein [Acidimicrobiales bacterium]
MSAPVVAIEGATKRFGTVTAVDDLSFTVEPGQVCGLLGPNGAGKTTVLRMLMGLERPSAGGTRLFGTTVEPSCAQLGRVGAMIEEAAFVPNLSGRRNLELWWRAGGAPLSAADFDGALAVAGLGDAVHRKVKTYSQGMKQRLGFARALLARAELLVLDEPTNGLDPGEIREIRELIGHLAAQGSTVLLSSHHLSEVENTCTHVVVMNKGRLVADGTVADLIGSGGAVYIEVDDRDRAGALLGATPGVTGIAPQGDGLVVDQSSGSRADLAAALVGAGLRLETIMPTQRLEDAFLDLLEARDPNGTAPPPPPSPPPGSPPAGEAGR